MANTTPGAVGTGDSDDSDSTTDTDSGSGGSSSSGVFSPPPVLSAFIDNPQNFILGAVLTTIVESVTGVVSMIYGQILFVVGGSEPGQFAAPGETLGIADVPVKIAELLTGAGGFTGSAIIGGIETFNQSIAAAASTVGPFGPAVIIVLLTVEAIVAIVVVRRIVYVVADLLQLGGLTE